MNVNGIRKALAQLLTDGGYYGSGFVPESVAAFPAGIVVGVREIELLTAHLAKLTIPVTIATDTVDYASAQKVLDDAQSTDTATSVWLLLTSDVPTDLWLKIRVASSDALRTVTDGTNKAFAVDFIVEVYAPR